MGWFASHSLAACYKLIYYFWYSANPLIIFYCFSSTGTWDVFVTTSDISSSSTNPKMSLTVCGGKGICTSITLPKGSLKKKQVYETSIELNKKFTTIFKVRLEIEEAGEGESWHCHEVKIKTKAKIES